MTYLSREIPKIDEIVNRINQHPEYDPCIKRKRYTCLNTQAAKHSVTMELTEEEGRYERSKGLENLSKAWDLLEEEGPTLTTLSRLGGLVAPDIPQNGFFRQEERAFGPFAAPHPHEVPTRIEHLCEYLASDAHPIRKAIEAHLQIVQTHPYLDGNGRAARLVQNYVLKTEGYIPIIIQAEEHADYIRMLQPTMRDRFNHNSSIYKPSIAEEQFHKLIAEKEVEAAQSTEDELRKQRIFNIQLAKTRNPARPYCVTRQLRGLRPGGRENNLRISVGTHPRKKKVSELTVRGDISRSELEYALQNLGVTTFIVRPDRRCANIK